MTLLTDTASPEEPGAEGCWLEGLPGVPAATAQHRADKQSTCVVNQSLHVTLHVTSPARARGGGTRRTASSMHQEHTVTPGNTRRLGKASSRRHRLNFSCHMAQLL